MHDGTGLQQAGGYRIGAGGHGFGQQAGAIGSDLAFNVGFIFNGHGQAFQWSSLALVPAGSGQLSFAQSILLKLAGKGIEFGIKCSDTLLIGLHQIDG